MIEAEWLACGDPDGMLKFLKDKASDRKLRWFAVACCRRIDALITDPRSRAALAFAEQHAEKGSARKKGKPAILSAAWTAYQGVFQKVLRSKGGQDKARHYSAFCAANAPQLALGEQALDAARGAANCSCDAVAWGAQAESDKAASDDLLPEFKSPEWAAQASLLFDIFGPLPFRRVVIDPPLLACNGGLVPKLAHGVYDDRAYDRLPILGDALEEAGCADADLLSHLRSPGPHVRGCWALDLILGKE